MEFKYSSLGNTIRKFRKQRNLSQSDLAKLLYVSNKTVSKWETGVNYPNINIIGKLAGVLQISVLELLSGLNTQNTNISCNIEKLKIYVCPICNNIICSTGEHITCCCGVILPELTCNIQAGCDVKINLIDNEYCLMLNHEMSKEHYISFIIAIKDDGYEVKKLYPECNNEICFPTNRVLRFYYYCNKHGLFSINV